MATKSGIYITERLFTRVHCTYTDNVGIDAVLGPPRGYYEYFPTVPRVAAFLAGPALPVGKTSDVQNYTIYIDNFQLTVSTSGGTGTADINVTWP